MDSNYYSSINAELFRKIPLSSQRILELGCGAGALGELFLKYAPLAEYHGVEVNPEVASIAKKKLTKVYVEDIESESRKKILLPARYDFIVCGDVLEHLVDPWTIVAELRQSCVSNGGMIASIPNVAHWSVITNLLRGDFTYENMGVLDKTHLRFFTKKTIIQLFTQAGWEIESITARPVEGFQFEKIVNVYKKIAGDLQVDINELIENLKTYQWVVRCINGPLHKSLVVAGKVLKKVAGVNEARVDYPLLALSSLQSNKVFWSEDRLAIPKDSPAGILFLHRQFLNDPEMTKAINLMASKGWVLVLDMDDDPRIWNEYVSTNFLAFKSVHAVTVSNQKLEALIKSWNPEVKVFQNQIFKIEPFPDRSDIKTRSVKFFYGALNREIDRQNLLLGINSLPLEIMKSMEIHVIHDQDFFDQLNPEIKKFYYSIVPHVEYMKILRNCDVALLPLRNTEFNSMKSDLKFIEACSHGVVPIASNLVYADVPEHQLCGEFVASDKPDEWAYQIQNLIKNRDLLIEKSSCAYDYVKNYRMHALSVSERNLYYRELLANQPQLEKDRLLRIELEEK